MTDLNSLPFTYVGFPAGSSPYLASASSINDRRVIGGTAVVQINGSSHGPACTIDLNSYTVTYIGTLPGETKPISVIGINNLPSPQVAGNTYSGQGFLYTAETGFVALPTGFSAYCINDAGGVGGRIPASYTHAAYWSPAGGLRGSGDLRRSLWTHLRPEQQRPCGRVCGQPGQGRGLARAFRWTVGSPATAIQDLNTLTPRLGKFILTEARAISDNGYIVSDATKDSQGLLVYNTYLLTPH